MTHPPSDPSNCFPGLSHIGALLADPGRAVMVWSLMDGTARPAGELALLAGLSPSAGSGHLARLSDGGLLTQEVRGRHRYYRIASAEIAAAIEALANVAQAAAPQLPVPRPVRTVPVAMRHARTCYDHMAGEVAVRVFDRFVTDGLLVEQGENLDVTDEGATRLRAWGIDVSAQRARKRRFACKCLDLSERRPHLSGALGAALLDAWTAGGWIERTGEPRVLRITPTGQRGFDTFIGI